MGREFPNRIRELREERSLSQRDLSSKTGIDFSTIQKLETGDTRLDLERMRRIAGAFGLKASALLPDEDVELRAGPENEDLVRELREIPQAERAHMVHMTREMVRISRGLAAQFSAAGLGGDQRQISALADIWNRFDDSGRQGAIDLLAITQRGAAPLR